jgi:hypothetical protein
MALVFGSRQVAEGAAIALAQTRRVSSFHNHLFLSCSA